MNSSESRLLIANEHDFARVWPYFISLHSPFNFYFKAFLFLCITYYNFKKPTILLNPNVLI